MKIVNYFKTFKTNIRVNIQAITENMKTNLGWIETCQIEFLMIWFFSEHHKNRDFF